MFKKIISILLVVILVVSLFVVSIPSIFAASNPYSEAAMQLDKDYAYDGMLGAEYSKTSTTFRVWAPTASSVKVNLFETGSDKEEGAKKIGTYDMTKLMTDSKFSGVWTAIVTGDLKNKFYTYSITRPDSILGGEEVTRETQDIYSYAVGVNGDRTMIVDLNETNPENFDKDKHVYVDKQTDASIWEIHVRDFTYNKNSGVSDENRGKYLGFTETGTTLENGGKISTCIDYLKSLGITHVEINPFYDFGSIDETKEDSDDKFNWGYDPKNYGTPEGSYSSNPYDGRVRIKECKQMIQALHEAGIGVIMDVVYNHTYSVDSCFNYCMPEYYYRMTATGAYSQQSGCGNDTASERFMYRRYMREMLNYWTKEYHIDGYRFDLMGIHDCETMNLIREDMDEIDPRIIMLGEGWGGNTVLDPVSCTGEPVVACTQTNAASADSRIAFFNDVIRDGIKGGVFDGPTTGGFVSGSYLNLPKVGVGIRANSMKKNINWTAKAPTQCVTYASCHDNHTLYDKLVNVNEGLAANYRDRFSSVITQNKFAGMIVKTSQGIDYMLAGEEMGRSKDGDENSYKSLSSENMVDWSLLVQNADLVSYYKGLLELRKHFSPFTTDTRDEDDDSFKYNWTTSPTMEGRYIAYTIDNERENEWSKVAVMFNSSANPREVTLLKNDTMDENTEWVIVANDKSAGITKLGEVKGLTFTVPASSGLVAVEKSSFEKVAYKSKFCTVNVKNITTDSDSVYSEYDLKGLEGEQYISDFDRSVPLKYEYSHSKGKESGTFSKESQDVEYYFDKFIPSMFTAPKGDVDDDGSVNIIDGTNVQKYIANLKKLDEEHVKRGDYDYNGTTEIIDVTRLQKYIANLDVTVFDVTSNYLTIVKDKESVLASSVKQYRVGEEYHTVPKQISFYTLKEMPKNADGIVSNNTTVNYYYVQESEDIKIHVKHSGDLTWAPSLWAWVHDSESGQDKPIYESLGWPGYTLKDISEDGWYETTISIPKGMNYSVIISKAGNPQTMDYNDIEYRDCYIVIDDESGLPSKGDWLHFYGEKPDLAE